MTDSASIIQSLRFVSRQLGFSDCRIAMAARSDGAGFFFDWLATGGYSGMDWMARNPERRCDPRLVLDGCRAVIMLSFNYSQQWHESLSHIAQYAWGHDYHAILEDKLADLDMLLQQYGGVQKYYVDSGPVLEREFAVKCGLGWRGRNGLVVRVNGGSRFFIATLLTTLELPCDPSISNHCGSCRRCIDSCPTGALHNDGKMDVSRCISYLTIENKGAIPLEMRQLLGGRIYGCDACLMCCPWNKQNGKVESRFQPDFRLRSMALADFLFLNESGFRDLFRHSPIRRIKLKRLQRNVCVALGNVGTSRDIPLLKQFLHGDDVLAEHAAWAISQIEHRTKMN